MDSNQPHNPVGEVPAEAKLSELELERLKVDALTQYVAVMDSVMADGHNLRIQLESLGLNLAEHFTTADRLIALDSKIARLEMQIAALAEHVHRSEQHSAEAWPVCDESVCSSSKFIVSL